MYKTNDIARITGVHPNTVRFYERLGLISPVPRRANGYRIFNEQHLAQVRVLRCIFLDEWPGEVIRKASLRIVEALKEWDLPAARRYTQVYQHTIATETHKARQALDILRQWSEQQEQAQGNLPTETEKTVETFSRTEAAAVIGVTPEALRNWERNDLVRVPRQGKPLSRAYGPLEMERLQVIYLLRQSRFSLSAIHRCLTKLDAGKLEEALESLKHPNMEDVVWTGDHWLAVLERTGEKAREIEGILEELE